MSNKERSLYLLDCSPTSPTPQSHKIYISSIQHIFAHIILAAKSSHLAGIATLSSPLTDIHPIRSPTHHSLAPALKIIKNLKNTTNPAPCQHNHFELAMNRAFLLVQQPAHQQKHKIAKSLHIFCSIHALPDPKSLEPLCDTPTVHSITLHLLHTSDTDSQLITALTHLHPKLSLQNLTSPELSYHQPFEVAPSYLRKSHLTLGNPHANPSLKIPVAIAYALKNNELDALTRIVQAPDDNDLDLHSWLTHRAERQSLESASQTGHFYGHDWVPIGKHFGATKLKWDKQQHDYLEIVSFVPPPGPSQFLGHDVEYVLARDNPSARRIHTLAAVLAEKHLGAVARSSWLTKAGGKLRSHIDMVYLRPYKHSQGYCLIAQRLPLRQDLYNLQDLDLGLGLDLNAHTETDIEQNQANAMQEAVFALSNTAYTPSQIRDNPVNVRLFDFFKARAFDPNAPVPPPYKLERPIVQLPDLETIYST